MKFLLIFVMMIFSFSYNLIVLNNEDKEKLNSIGFVCSKKNNVYVCLSSNDLNELKRIKEFLKTKLDISSQIVGDVSNFTSSKKVRKKLKVKSVKTETINTSIKNGYCIQVGSFKHLNNAKYEFNRYKKFPFVRIEKIGKFYTLRIGEDSYEGVKSLNKYINGIVKKCDLIPSRILLSNFELNISKTAKNVNVSNSSNTNIDNKILSSTISISKNNKQDLRLMYNALNSGDLVKARELALKLKNLYPDDANLVLGIIAMKKGDFKKACNIFSSLKQNVKLKKDACHTYYVKEGFSLLNSDPKKALSFFNKALKYKSNDKNSMLGKGYAYINLKEYKKAYKIFKKLYKKYPDNKKVVEGYINVLYLLKKYDELEKLRSILPQDIKKELDYIDFYMKLKNAQKLLKQKKYNEAEKILIELYTQKPDDINVLLSLANLYLQTNKLDKSLSFYKNVLVVSPDNIYALRGLEAIYMKNGNYQKALKYSDKIISLGFKDENRYQLKKFYYINLAKEYLKENKINKAKKILQKAYSLNKKDPLVLSLLGDIAFKENNLDLAYLYYAKSYSLAPTNFGITLKFLYALLRLNLFDQIKIILSKINTSVLNEKQKELLRQFYINLYAKYASYLLKNKEYKSALEVVNNGLLMDSDNYNLLSTKAWICLKLKKYECAKKYFELALSNRDDDNLKYGLALVYLNLGNKTKAENILDSIHTDNKELKIKIAGAYVRLGEIDKAKALLRGIKKPSLKIKEKPLNQIQNENIINDKFFPNPFLKTSSKQNLINNNIDMYPVKKKIVLKEADIKQEAINKEYESIQKEIQKIEQNYINNIKIGFKIRSKSGESGVSKLNRISFPYIKGEYFIKDKKIVFILNGEYLDSGEGNGSLKTQTGGVAGEIGYETDNFKVHVGFTPAGTNVGSSTFVGDIGGKLKKGDNTFYATLYRKSLKDTLTSYVGNIKNNEKFSRVIKNGLKLGYKKDLDKNGSFVYTDVSFNYLKGKNIIDNSSIESELLYLNYIGDSFLDKNLLGFYVNLAHFDKNNDFFYPPYGGYFSPKLFLLVMPRYEGYLYSKDRKFVSKLTAMIGGSYINNWTKSSVNFAYDLEYALKYLLFKNLAVESGVDFRNSKDYSDVFFTLMFRYYFGNKTSFSNKDIDDFSQKVISW